MREACQVTSKKTKGQCVAESQKEPQELMTDPEDQQRT
jgi:hypothetical protein